MFKIFCSLNHTLYVIVSAQQDVVETVLVNIVFAQQHRFKLDCPLDKPDVMSLLSWWICKIPGVPHGRSMTVMPTLSYNIEN